MQSKPYAEIQTILRLWHGITNSYSDSFGLLINVAPGKRGGKLDLFNLLRSIECFYIQNVNNQYAFPIYVNFRAPQADRILLLQLQTDTQKETKRRIDHLENLEEGPSFSSGTSQPGTCKADCGLISNITSPPCSSPS